MDNEFRRQRGKITDFFDDLSSENLYVNKL